MDEARARRTLVTNWWLLHKEPGLKIINHGLDRSVRGSLAYTFVEFYFNSGRDNDYNTLTGQDMKLSSEPTWDSAMISARRMAKTIKDCV